MSLTEWQMKIVSLIDGDVMRVGQTAKNKEAADEAIIEMLPKHIDGFKHLLDTLDSKRMNELCTDFPGFYMFAEMMERMAAGCRDGRFDDIIAKQVGY